MSRLKKGLALVLTLCMMLSLMPVITPSAKAGSTDDFYKIVHVDAGRKYFSPENIKEIIDNAAAAGFNQVELYLSDNQGFRFALNDMNVTTSTGKTYDLTPALGDGYVGTDGKYPDGSGKYLTQSEMTDIISYATGKGIEIVPCINVPGHMGAILEEFTQFKYSGSDSSIDLENKEAVAFALAITQKYVDYFKTQGVKYYNIGADEYANDLSSMGFEGMGSALYTKFVEFLNSAADIIIAADMTPRAFNDGFLYKDYDISVTPNTAYQICYWSSGWSGYDLASAKTLSDAGYKLINTHGDYYWVLGNSSWQCSAEKASGFDSTSFQGGTISDPAGAMFCIWCDEGNKNGTDGGTAVVSATADVIAAFGAALPASETGDGDSGNSGNTGNTGDVAVTENENITVTVGQTATATISDFDFTGTYTTEDPSIATVEVTGKDAVEATTTYTEASVTCNTLISSNSNNWTAVSGYYYKADDGNYYPLYAKRSSSWSWSSFSYTYTYTWGYSTTNSTRNVDQIGTQSTTDTSTTPNITVYTKSDKAATPASTAVTFTGVAVGTTYVTVGNTRYTINVVAEDLSTVTPLTVEFWITNQRVTANGATSMNIAASASGVYSESGALFSALVPATGTQNNNPMVFWKGTRLASNNKQTTGGGVDKTKSGTDFTYIRYWEGSWAYSTDGETWTNVASGDQIVAYYLQKTEVTDEITTYVSDWGEKFPYSITAYVLVDYAVKYESGERVPNAFPITSTTQVFHCTHGDPACSRDSSGNYYRNIGTVKAEETADYEVYMITLTPTSDAASKKLTSNASSNTVNQANFYAGTEKVVWVDDEANLGDFADESLHYTSISGNITYKVGGEPTIGGLEIYDLHGMLVTYYVRAKVTEDSLAVHYIDQTANSEFYSYNIAVKSGTLFNENISLADPWKGNLANGSVTNLLDKTQTVSADLSTMPAIGAQYRYSDYTCVKVERNADGKNVYLYYTFNNAHSFVADFGLPLKIDSAALGNLTGDWTSVTLTGAKYGTIEDNTVGKYFVYTPSKVFQGTETLQLTLTDATGSATHQIYIYPATTVYYEEGFASYAGSWTGNASKGTGTQATQIGGSSSNVYGYDKKYADESYGPSNNTQATSTTKGNKAEFTFTGTGVEIYANSDTGTGKLMIQVKNSAGSTVKLLQVDTALQNGSSDATTGQNVTGYNVPVASITGLTNGAYTVTITHVDDKTVNLDGFRVYGTLVTEPDFYKTDLEDNPTFIELRDQVLAGLSVTGDGSNQTNAALPTGANAVIVASSEKYTQANVDDLLKNGPKNEIYLQKDQALVLKITTAREVQIGLKALNAATTYTINNGESKNISTSTDMFYTVLNKGTSGEQTITITNTGYGILSVTKLKVCDDPNATLGTLTEEDLTDALVSLGLQDPVEDNGSSGTETDPGADTPITPADPETGLPFTDVGPGDWFLENVKYVYEKGLMNGTSDTTFSPKKTTNRAMIVTILHRLEGTPAPDAQAPFTDVPAGQYYAEAVAWAAANGIVNGTSDTTFAPLNNITREQMAAILYRYAQYKEYDVSGSADLSAFTDAASISDYAVSALQWAVDAGLINGKGNGILDPKGSATRAEVSAILSRFCENIAG